MAKPAGKIRSVAFVSLGCPKNLVDSERMLGLLAQDGLAITADPADADAIIINTCGFLEASKDESLQAIREAIEQKKTGKCKRVVVAGCLVQRHKTRLLADVPEVDRLVGVFDREHIVEAVHGKANPRQEHGHFLGKYHDLSRELREGSGFGVQGSGGEAETGVPPVRGVTEVDKLGSTEAPHTQHGRDARVTSIAIRPSALSPRPSAQSSTSTLPVFEDDRARLRLTPRHYAYLRISEGCNQGCTFCTIPSIRGPMRSKPVEQILAEARELAADGAVELNLIGQDTTSYGSDIGYAAGLSGLLKTLDKQLKDVHWLRLMYAYPSCFTDDMIRTIADSGRVVKYIDMPLQHIDDKMLTAMRRRVTRKQIETLLEKLRTWVPGIAIRTTFIAGAPGETDKQHEELVEFVKDFGFDMMGVFPYSREPGTAMGRMEDHVPDDVKQARVEELMLAQQEVAFAKAKRMKGKMIDVLIDRPAGRDEEDGWVARSQSQAPDIDSVTFVHGRNLHLGQLACVKVTDYQAYDLVAEVPRKKSRSLSVLAS
jgi:ribosomal protein S12 methylthiotransferase